MTEDNGATVVDIATITNPASGWISAEDRLPPTNVVVLATEVDAVVYWRPLPTPPHPR